MSKNQKVNDDGGLEPLVKICENSFKQCACNYQVFSNLKYKFQKRDGEIDVLVIFEDEILLIECKAPLMPTSAMEMRATYEHVEKACKHLDLSKKAFEDNGFSK